ncbi:MAG: ABC transporter substrate-binding protein [Propioniciclava sp.]
MSKRSLIAAGAIALTLGLALGACTPDAPENRPESTDDGTIVTLAQEVGFSSANIRSRSGGSPANTGIAYLTHDTFTYVDADLATQPNPGLGTYTKVQNKPLTITQTIAESAVWSDGVPVTPADLVLSYGAQSTLYNTVDEDEVTREEATGQLTWVNEGTDVYFDAADPGLALVGEFPAVEGSSVTFVYDEPYADWEEALVNPDLPAHVVGRRALGIEDPTQAADAVLRAFADNDGAALAKIANVWNSDFTMTTMPEDPGLLLATGPYLIDTLSETSIELVRNPAYVGEHTPTVDRVSVRVIPDPQARLQALRSGEVLAAQPRATAELLAGAGDLDPVAVLPGSATVFEHLDLAQNNGGPFDAATYAGDAAKARLVRAAFLHTVPRQQIVDDLIAPLNADASIRDSYNVVPGAENYAAMVKANGMEETYGEGADLEAAADLLERAGVATPVTVRILFEPGNPMRMQEFQLIKASAEAEGLFTIENGAREDWDDKLTDTLIYDAALFGWRSTLSVVDESEAAFRTGGQNNYYGYSNADVDKLFDRLDGELNTTRQQRILRRIEQNLVDDAFGLTLYQQPDPVLVNERLGNVSTMPLAPGYLWNFWEWTLSE